MSEFTPISTQEEFDKAIKSRLAQKDRELAEKYKDYLSPEDAKSMKDDFEKQLQDANKQLTDIQEKISSYDATVAELTKRAETAETSLLKSKVAYEKKLPLELASRLIGSTEEELKADAESLSGIIKPQGAGAPPLYLGSQRTQGGDSIQSAMSQLVEGINAQLSS